MLARQATAEQAVFALQQKSRRHASRQPGTRNEARPDGAEIAMTILGKLLVYPATRSWPSILFGWAVSLYTNRVDWFDRTTEEGTKIDGQLNATAKPRSSGLSEQIKASKAGLRGGRLAARGRTPPEPRRTRPRPDVWKLSKRMDAVKNADDKVRFLEHASANRSPLPDRRFATNGSVVNGPQRPTAPGPRLRSARPSTTSPRPRIVQPGCHPSNTAEASTTPLGDQVNSSCRPKCCGRR